MEPVHPLELDQKCRYTNEPKPKFTDQETRNIDEPDPKFTDQDLVLVNVPTKKPFLCSSGTRFTAQGSFLTKNQSPQNKSKLISYHRRKSTCCVFMRLNGKFLDTKRIFPTNQEVHYSWCPKI